MNQLFRHCYLTILILWAGTLSLAAQSSGFPSSISPYSGYTEVIHAFDADITVEKDGKLIIVEKIKVQAAGFQIKRGIFRLLPTTRHINGRQIHISYKVLDVKKNGRAEKYHTKRENNTLGIYIGQQDVLLEQGVYEYEIAYETERQIGYFDTYDEIYWNATGNFWQFPIISATAKVRLPYGSRILQSACYTGSQGSTSRNCASEKVADNMMSFSASNLAPYEGLTVAVGFPKGIVEKPEVPGFLQKNNLVNLLGAFIGGIIILMMSLWYRYGVDEIKPTVVPQFDVPEDLPPAEVGYLHQGYYKQSFLAATIINLAVKNCIIIKDVPKKGLFGKQEYVLIRTNVVPTDLNMDEREFLYRLLPAPGSTLTMDGSYNSSVASAVTNYRARVTEKHKKLLTEGSNKKYPAYLFLAITLIYWPITIMSYMTLYDEGKLVFSILMYVVAAVLFLICIFMRLGVSRWFWMIPSIITAIIYYADVVSDQSIDQFDIAVLFLFLSISGVCFFSYVIRKPSKELLRKQSLIDGFKMYMNAAENQLIKFHNPPKMTPQIFERYLPYALVLGVQDVWGKKFDSYLKENPEQYSSAWYTGGSYNSLTSHISSSLSQSLSQSISAAATQPSSSGGSGGGGFSGGGGGGGGGGGW